MLPRPSSSLESFQEQDVDESVALLCRVVEVAQWSPLKAVSFVAVAKKNEIIEAGNQNQKTQNPSWNTSEIGKQNLVISVLQ